jgi:hypothetical protein
MPRKRKRAGYLIKDEIASAPPDKRGALVSDYAAALATDFELHGPAVIERLRVDDPGAYVRAVGALAPRQSESEVSVSSGALDAIDAAQTEDEIARQMLLAYGAAESAITGRMVQKMRTELARHHAAANKIVGAPVLVIEHQPSPRHKVDDEVAAIVSQVRGIA